MLVQKLCPIRIPAATLSLRGEKSLSIRGGSRNASWISSTISASATLTMHVLPSERDVVDRLHRSRRRKVEENQGGCTFPQIWLWVRPKWSRAVVPNRRWLKHDSRARGGESMTGDPLADAAFPIPATAPSASDAPWPSPRVAWYAVFVFALVLMINFLDRGIVGLLMPSIKADLHLTNEQMNYLVDFAFIVISIF